MDTPQERLRIFIKNNFKTQRAFADAFRVGPTYIEKYVKENGSVFQGEEQRKKLSDLGLNVDWYLTGEGDMLVSKESSIEYTKVPSLISAHKCGVGVSFNDELEFEDIPTQVIDKMHEPYIITASGSSISPAIQDGDKVLIERNKQPINGDIVAVFLNGEYMIKVFDYKKDRLTLYLRSINPDYNVLTIGEHDTFQIFGVAVKYIRTIERIKL